MSQPNINELMTFAESTSFDNKILTPFLDHLLSYKTVVIKNKWI